MRSRIVWMFLGAVLVACSGGGGGNSGSSVSSISPGDHLDMQYSNASGSALNQSTMNQPLPLFFGVVGVAGYYYRPGAGSVDDVGTVPTANNIPSDDWSAWNMIPFVEDSAEDFVLPGGGSLDMKKLAGNQWYDGEITPTYVSNVGVFSFDFIFVQGLVSIVLPDHTVCGMGAQAMGPREAERAQPGLTFAEPGGSNLCLQVPFYNGKLAFGPNSIMAVVARRDWFPAPVTISYYIPDGTLACWTSDIALSTFQIEMVDSIMQAESNGLGSVQAVNWLPGNYHAGGCTSPTGQVASNLFVSPETTDVPVVQFTERMIPVPPTLSPQGNTIPQPPQIVIGSNLKANVSFSLTPNDITNWPAVSNSLNYWGCVTSDCIADETVGIDTYGTPLLLMAASSNGAPWGMSVSFTATKPAVLPNSNSPSQSNQ